MTQPPVPVVISGKICSGKNYLAEHLALTLNTYGYTTAETAFGNFLKEELTAVINTTYTGLTDGSTREHILTNISNTQTLTRAESALILDTIIDTVHGTLMAGVDRVDGWSRNTGVRRGCQVLGTDIRRAKDNDYWVNKARDFVTRQPVDFVLLPDGRFPNEMALAAEDHGVRIRVEVPLPIREQRLWERDQRKFTQEELTHTSETSLDDYEEFDMILGPTYSLDEVAVQVIAAR